MLPQESRISAIAHDGRLYLKSVRVRLFGAAHGPYSEGENTQGKRLLPLLPKDMLLPADRGSGCYPFFSKCIKTGASLVFRIRNNMKFAEEKILPDVFF